MVRGGCLPGAGLPRRRRAARALREQLRREQGADGDCDVIATLGAVAEHRPQDIVDAIRENEDGAYEARFHGAKSVGVGRYEPTGDITAERVARCTLTA